MGAPDPLIDTILADDFRVLRQVGFGGYARVYLAEQLSVGRRKVAVKVLHALHMDSKQAVAALKREATFLAMLRSPCFPRIYRTGVTPAGIPFFAMEFVVGRTVEAMVREFGRFSVADTVTVLDEVCEGLAEMHGRDIVHRDLKTGNVALEEAPAARLHTKLLDLGSAKPAYEADPTGTKAWATMGSPPYLPPETAARGVASETGDIYGLGAIGYEMLCGIRAIHIRDTSPEAYSSYLRSTQPIPTYRIQTIQPDVPESIEAVIQRALSREPRERFPSVNAFRAALLQAAGRPAGPTGIAAPAAAPGKAEAGKPAPEPKKKTESLAFRTKESLRKLVPLNFGKR